MLWQLAKRNVSRNWTKSVLGILGIAIAAAVMTASFSLQTGYPEGARRAYRGYIGGDVVIYPGTVGMEYHRALDDDGEKVWQWTIRRDQGLNDLSIFHPNIYDEGYVSPPDERTYFQPGELPQPLQSEHLPEQVESVQSLYKMPVQLVAGHEDGGQEVHPISLRARDVEMDHQQWERWSMADYVHQGRWFEPDDDGSLVAMAYGVRPQYPDFEGSRPQFSVPPVCEQVTIRVPRLLGYRDGFPVWDWDDPKIMNLAIVGHFAFATESRPVRQLVLEDGQVEQLDEPAMVQHYVETEDLFVPQSTWHKIFDKVAPSGLAPRVYQLNLVLSDMFYAKDVSEQIGQQMNDATVRTVPEQVVMGRDDRGQSVVPADVSTMVIAGSLAIAGLLLVANMYILVMQRRKDMAILKAIGMSPAGVMKLILLETMLIALIGATLGFGLVRLGITGALLLSEVTAAEIGILTLRTGVMVIGSSIILALVFGLLPAYQAVRQTTMEVLRDVET